MDGEFVRQRITELRMRNGCSEYKLSYELGHSKSYINNITRGKAMPTIKELISICDYFGITAEQFFAEGTKYPELIQQAIDGMKLLNEADLNLILQHIRRLNQN